MAVLEESVVLEILSLYPDLDDSNKEWAKEQVSAYADEQDRKGESYFPGLEKAEAAERSAIQQFIINGDVSVLGPEREANFNNAIYSAHDPLTASYRFTADTLVSHLTGLKGSDLAWNGELEKERLAKEHLGYAGGPISDEQFVNDFKNQFRLKVFVEQEAFGAAVDDWDLAKAWGKSLEKMKGMSGYKPESESQMWTYFSEVYTANKPRADRVRAKARSALGIFRSANTNEDKRVGIDYILSLNPEDRELAMEMMKRWGSKVEGAWEQIVMTSLRSTLGWANGTERSISRDRISELRNQLRGNKVLRVPEGMHDMRAIHDYLAYEAPSIEKKNRSLRAPIGLHRGLREVSVEERELIFKQSDAELEALNLIQEMTEVYETEVDGMGEMNGLMRHAVIPLVSSLPSTVVGSVPLIGGAANYYSYQDEAYRSAIKEGATHEEAMKHSAMVAAGQSLMDYIPVGGLAKKIPGVKQLGRRLDGPDTSGLTRGMYEFGVDITAETSQELAQGHVIPTAVQAVTGVGGPVDLKQMTHNMMQEFPQTLLLSGVMSAPSGVIAGGNHHVRTKEFTSAPLELRVAGFSDAQAREIYAQATPQQRVEKARELWQKREGTDLTMSEARAELEEIYRQQRDGEQALVVGGALPEMQRTEKGWKLHFDDGNSTEFSSYKDATQARWNSYEARVLNLNGAVREAIENSERNLTNNQARRFEFDADTMSVSRMKRENPQLTATLDERMEISSFMDDGRAEQQQYAEAVAGNAALSQDRETIEASTLVLGTSSVSFRKGVRVGVSKLYRGFNAASVVEETLETDASHLLKNGKREWMIKALRETEQQTGEQLLPKGVADADLTVLQLKEAYSHVGVSLFAGEAVKDRNGKANPRLSNNRKWLLGVQRSALGRAMNASAQKFAAMFRRAQRLEQARVGDAKPGDGGSTLQAELEETLNRSLGLSEGAVVNATENGTIDSTADVNAEGEVSFSLLAPNGQPSQLTEELWQAVRTPEFKEQFGDWEAADLGGFLSGPPVIKIKDQAPSSGLAAVREWASSIFRSQGGNAKNPILGDVILNERSVRDSLAHGKPNRAKYNAFAAVKDVIERGRLVHSVIDGRLDSFYISAPVKIGDVDDIVTALVRRDMNSSRMYLHSVIKKEHLLSHRVSGADTKASELPGSSKKEGVRIILEAALSVNPSTVSKIVDVNGEPLVAYPVTSPYANGLTFTADKNRATTEGTLDQPVFLKAFDEGQDFNWDRDSDLITVKSPDQVMAFTNTDSSSEAKIDDSTNTKEKARINDATALSIDRTHLERQRAAMLKVLEQFRLAKDFEKGGKLSPIEAIGGYRIQESFGVKIQSASELGVDFIGPGKLGKIQLKGPFINHETYDPLTEDQQQLAITRILKKFLQNTAPDSIVIDTLGLSERNITNLKFAVTQQGLKKPVYYIE